MAPTASAHSDALPTRPRGPAGPAVLRRPPAGTDATHIADALHQIHGSIDSLAINGVLVATRDGLVLCGTTRGIDGDGVAAMAAAAAGLAAQFTTHAQVGTARAVFFEGDAGQVGVFGVDPSTILVVLGGRDTTMGMFNVVAKQTLTLLQQAITAQTIRHG